MSAQDDADDLYEEWLAQAGTDGFEEDDPIRFVLWLSTEKALFFEEGALRDFLGELGWSDEMIDDTVAKARGEDVVLS